MADAAPVRESLRVVYRDPRYTEMIAETKGAAKKFSAQLIRDRKKFTVTPTRSGWTFEVEEVNEPSRWESM